MDMRRLKASYQAPLRTKSFHSSAPLLKRSPFQLTKRLKPSETRDFHKEEIEQTNETLPLQALNFRTKLVTNCFNAPSDWNQVAQWTSGLICDALVAEWSATVHASGCLRLHCHLDIFDLQKTNHLAGGTPFAACFYRVYLETLAISNGLTWRFLGGFFSG